MSQIFVVKNQHGLYLSKQQEWVSGADAQGLYRSEHKDEAINTVFEVSSRDIYLRAEILACDTSEKGLPIVEVTAQPVQNTADETPDLIEQAQSADHAPA